MTRTTNPHNLRQHEAAMKRRVDHFRARVKATKNWKTVREHQAHTRALNCLRRAERVFLEAER